MITLPLEPVKWPIFRVQTLNKWSTGTSEATNSGAWQDMPMLQKTKRPDVSGFRVLSYSRCLLPQIGTARLAFYFGRFLGKVIGAQPLPGSTPASGGTWDPATDNAAAPDLTGKEIRIQAALPPDDPAATPAWKTVFWGTCEYQLDKGQGAADIPAGDRVYHLVDGLERLKRWFPDNHGFLEGGAQIQPAYGHPGFNVSQRSAAAIAGNKDPSAAVYYTKSNAPAFYFTRPGAGTQWTDKEAIENILAVSTPQGQPLFRMTGAVAHFDNKGSVEVNDSESVFDLITRIASRGKGNGALGLELTDSGNTLTVGLRTWSQLAYGLSYPVPSTGLSALIFGAGDYGTLVDVDVIGDHRFVDGSLLLGDSQQYECDYNETFGEKIQVLATISAPDQTLEPAWKTAEAAAFRALALTARRDMIWFPVYQSYRLKRGFDFITGNGLGTSTKIRCDYSCNDAGNYSTYDDAKTSPANVRIMDDLPLFEGYDYSGSPVRHDGQTETGTPARIPPFFFFRNSTKATPGDTLPVSVALKIHDDTISVYRNDDQPFGSRYISEAAYPAASLGTQLENADLAVTVGLEMPHRVRIASGVKGSARRRKNFIPGLHLWLAAYKTTYGFAPSTDNQHTVYDNCCPATSGVIRDDRDALAAKHWLSVAWYGPSSALGAQGALKRNASWSLRCCPDIPSSTAYDGGFCVYPQVGQCIGFLSANGQRNSIATPVSSVVYDNESGIATWTTDWQDLDFQ